MSCCPAFRNVAQLKVIHVTELHILLKHSVLVGDLTWGGEHTVQCTEDILWNCAPETCIILLTCITPVNSIKRKKKQCSSWTEVSTQTCETTKERNKKLKSVDCIKINFEKPLKLILWTYIENMNLFPRLKTTSPLT